MTLEYIQQIGHNLTGLDITTDIYLKTSFTELFYTSKKRKIDKLFINFNIDEIDNIPDYQLIDRGVILKYKYIFVILHEVAHYKKFKKFKNAVQFDNWADNNFEYKEKSADRYAKRYYKKFIDKGVVYNEV